MASWKKSKYRNYGIKKLIRQDLWGKYARKRANRLVINKYEYRIMHHDDAIYKTPGSSMAWLLYQLHKKREVFPHRKRERDKDRNFRTRKLLQFHYENLNFHNIKIHIKKSGVKNGLGRNLNFYKMLERRLDVMCVRSHFYSTLKEAKQFIKNGFIMVNDKIIKSCNYILKDKDILTVKPEFRLDYKLQYLKKLLTGQILRGLPPYLSMNIHTFKIIFISELFSISKIPYFSFFPWQRFPNYRKKP
jgi:ribosomal protein S4